MRFRLWEAVLFGRGPGRGGKNGNGCKGGDSKFDAKAGRLNSNNGRMADAGLAIVVAIGRLLPVTGGYQSSRGARMNRERYGVPQAIAKTHSDAQHNKPSGPVSEMSSYLHLKYWLP